MGERSKADKLLFSSSKIGNGAAGNGSPGVAYIQHGKDTSEFIKRNTDGVNGFFGDVSDIFHDGVQQPTVVIVEIEGRLQVFNIHVGRDFVVEAESKFFFHVNCNVSVVGVTTEQLRGRKVVRVVAFSGNGRNYPKKNEGYCRENKDNFYPAVTLFSFGSSGIRL